MLLGKCALEMDHVFIEYQQALIEENRCMTQIHLTISTEARNRDGISQERATENRDGIFQERYVQDPFV